jgi:DAACS family dicarboxylate/amino acid:cation (Na+ or H+) symporter
MKQHIKLLLGLGLGIILGVVAHHFALDSEWLNAVSKNLFAPIGQIFLRLIFMIVVPMVVSALILGVFELGQGRGLGRIAAKTLLYTILASSASVIIGIALVNSLKPGAGFQISLDVSQQAAAVEKIQSHAANSKSIADSIVEIVPKNPMDAAVRALDGEMLSLMFFALMFGFALAMTTKPGEDNPLIGLLRSVFDVCLRIVDYAMKLAPYAVFAIVFNTAFRLGYEVFTSIFYYVFCVVLGLLIQQFVVYSALLKFIAHRNPWEFFKKSKEVYLYAFATASSNATLPRSLECAEQDLGMPARISRFVLTVGSTANQNGTALFEGITVLFLAQVYSIDLSLGQQVQVVLMSILAGIGTAGVPGGSLPLIMILLQQMGIPVEGMALILGVDRFLDMCRTTLNVSGDLVIAAMVSNGEKA